MLTPHDTRRSNGHAFARPYAWNQSGGVDQFTLLYSTSILHFTQGYYKGYFGSIR